MIHGRVVLIFIVFCSAGCVTRVDFVVPDGFRGPAVILFDDPLGEDVKSVGWQHEEYRFPRDGVLRFRTPFAGRLEKQKFFFADQSGKRTEIPQGNSEGVQILSFLIASEPRREPPPNGGSFTTTEGGFAAVVFIVGKPADYPVPSDAAMAFEAKIMHQEYARIAATGR
jgi:hypothetical protein